MNLTTRTTQRGRVRVEHGAKRIRAYLGGQLVADTTRPLLVWEKPQYPAYYIPATDVRSELLVCRRQRRAFAEPGRRRDVHDQSGWHGGAGEQRFAMRTHLSRICATLSGSTGTRWTRGSRRTSRCSRHPRDPYTRVDILPKLPSCADRGRRSDRGRDLEADALVRDRASDSLLRAQDACPYGPADADRHRKPLPVQGSGRVVVVRAGDTVHTDLAWSYRTTLPESQKIAGLMAFYDEKVDVYVDGVLQERPRSRFA